MTKKPPPEASQVPAAAPTTLSKKGRGKTAATKPARKVSKPTAKSPKVPARQALAPDAKPGPRGSADKPGPAKPEAASKAKTAKVLELVPKSPKVPPKPPKAPPPQSSALGDAISSALKEPAHIPGTPKPIKPGRKSPPYSRGLMDRILERLSNGELLNDIGDEDGMPLASTVRKWVMADIDGLAQRYAQARELGWTWHAEEIARLSNKARVGAKVKTSADGVEIQTADMVERTRLQIDTRKWLLSKLLPKTYGDKVEHTGNVTLTLADRLKAMSEAEVGRHAAVPND